MGFLSGGLACTRFNIISMPETVNFDRAPFRLISPGSNITESSGFVPFEIDEDYEIGVRKYAFRVRIDKVNVDTTMVQERLRELIKVEIDQGGRVGPQIKRKLKTLAEQEVLAESRPRSKVIEGVIDGDILYMGSTSKSQMGNVLELLKVVDVEVEYKTPWLDKGWEEEPSEFVDLKEPGQSLFGCRFLKALHADQECLFEPEKGSVKLATAKHAKVSVSGEVESELDRYIEEGAELLSAKILLNDLALTFDGLAYRINGLKLESIKADHWTEILDGRMEMLRDVWDTLDSKFETLMVQGAAATT